VAAAAIEVRAALAAAQAAAAALEADWEALAAHAGQLAEARAWCENGCFRRPFFFG
jgi:hypothetical protein